jgi:histone acetyltransferase (RNA polymerase elongator complex component)
MDTISDDQSTAGFNKETSNSISESNHTQSTHSLKMYGTVRLDSAAAEGMTRTNNDFGRGHEALVTGHTSKDGKVSRVFGTFHSLPIELQESLIVAAKQNAKSVKKSFDEALAKQKAARLREDRNCS